MDLINILFAKALSNGDTDEAIKALKGEVSADLDTLEELSKALGNDPNFFLTIKNEIDGFKTELVTNKDAATENTRFAIGVAEQNLEVPSMEEFNQLKDRKLDNMPATWPAWTADEQAQARENIEAASEADVNELKGDLAAITPDDSAVDGKPWTSEKIVEALCPPFETTGSIMQCHPVEHYPLGVVSRIEPVQSGSGDPSSDNVRPISGWDSVHVTRCGKNLLKASKSDITRELNGIVGNYTANNDTFAIKGTNKASSNFLILSITPYVYPYFKPGDKYTILNNSPNGIYINLTYINTSGNIASLVYNDTQTTFTVPEDYIMLNKLQVGISTSVSTVDTTFNIQLEVGSTATAYEPYTGDTYTAELPETIYGGELDWNTGVLTVDRRITIADGTVNKFTPDRVGDFWNMPFKSAPGTIDVVGVQNSHFEKNKFGLNGYDEFLFTMPAYMNGLFDTADNLNAYLVEQNASGTPVTFVYKLKMPYTIQITPQQIAALSGVNTLCTDSGDTTVSGRTDPVWLTQSLMERIAALESAATNI